MEICASSSFFFYWCCGGLAIVILQQKKIFHVDWEWKWLRFCEVRVFISCISMCCLERFLIPGFSWNMAENYEWGCRVFCLCDLLYRFIFSVSVEFEILTCVCFFYIGKEGNTQKMLRCNFVFVAGKISEWDLKCLCLQSSWNLWICDEFCFYFPSRLADICILDVQYHDEFTFFSWNYWIC